MLWHHPVGLYDGCCPVKSIEVWYFLSNIFMFKLLSQPLHVLWNWNNGKSRSLRCETAVKVVVYCFLWPQWLHFRNPLVNLTYCIRFHDCAQKHGIEHAPIELHHGDFLQSSAVKDAISSAGLVYMNNPRFGPQLNFQILGVQSFVSFIVNPLFNCFWIDQLCPLMPKGCKLVILEISNCQLFCWKLSIKLSFCLSDLLR